LKHKKNTKKENPNPKPIFFKGAAPPSFSADHPLPSTLPASSSSPAHSLPSHKTNNLSPSSNPCSPISLHYSQHSLYPLLSQPVCSSSSPIEVSRRCTHRTSSPLSAAATPTEPSPSSLQTTTNQPRTRSSLSHRGHRLPARSRQIFPLQPATGHGLHHQHRRDKASLIGADRPPAAAPAVFFISSPPALQRRLLPITATPPPH